MKDNLRRLNVGGPDQNYLALSGNCHPDTPMMVMLDRKAHNLRMACGICEKVVVDFEITGNLRPAPLVDSPIQLIMPS